jgi:nucleoside-diphosphate-sugar epimerase
MRILITGAAGNLGSFLTRSLLDSPHELRLLVHRNKVATDIADHRNVEICRADLAEPDTLADACRGADCIVHLAGVLFAPRPEKFLPATNLMYVKNLVSAALAARVGKIILISFPHVEGGTSPEKPACGRLDGQPSSVHARTRLAAEQHLFTACQHASTTTVALRAGMIYGRGVLMIEAARWLMKHRLLAVWRETTWEHLLALPDFLTVARTAIERPDVSGVYNVADDQPIALQEFLDTIAVYWGYHKPWRCPRWMFPLAAASCEAFASVFETRSPLTRDFIKIGMVSSVADTSRMKRELLPRLAYPTLRDGLELL